MHICSSAPVLQEQHPAFEQFALMHKGLGADAYTVQVRDPVSDTGGMVGKRMGFEEVVNRAGRLIPLIPADRVVDTIIKTEKKVTGEEKWSPIIRPISSTKTYILVDDLDNEKLQALKTKGFKPALVQETSPQNYQAIIVIPKINDRKIANAVATQIKTELGGDAACNGADHTMRAAGFENAKPKHQRPDGSYPVVTVAESIGGFCPKATAIAEHIIQNLPEREPTKQLSPRDNRGTSDASWIEKQTRTAEKVFSSFGTDQLNKYAKYHGAWERERDSALIVMERDVKRAMRENKVAELRKTAMAWDNRAAFGPVLYIDNEKAFIKSKRGVFEVAHAIPYEDRPKTGADVMLTKNSDGQVVLKDKSPQRDRGHGMGD